MYDTPMHSQAKVVIVTVIDGWAPGSVGAIPSSHFGVLRADQMLLVMHGQTVSGCLHRFYFHSKLNSCFAT